MSNVNLKRTYCGRRLNPTSKESVGIECGEVPAKITQCGEITSRIFLASNQLSRVRKKEWRGC